MEVRWAPHAADDLERIFYRIGKDNPTAAREVVATIYEGCSELKSFPNRGRPSRIKGRRELVFPRLPYIVVYRVQAGAVEISRIYHAAQDWPQPAPGPFTAFRNADPNLATIIEC